MLNHAADVNRKRMDVKIARRKENPEPPTLRESLEQMPTWNGKPLNQLTSDEYLAYHRAPI